MKASEMRDMRPRFAGKILSAVEVKASASHQHEFHAGSLRRALGFDARTSGPFTLIVYGESEPIVVKTKYTIYDARENIEGRSEWRFYYYGSELQKYASGGDFLLIIRPDMEGVALHAVIARSGSELDHRIRAAFAIGDDQEIKRFARLETTRNAQLAEDFANALFEEVQPFGDLRRHELHKRAAKESRLPDSDEIAAAASQIVMTRFGHQLDSDAYLYAIARADTLLFEQIEAGLGDRQLAEIVSSGAGYPEVMNFALDKLRSRKARRGESLFRHFETLLRNQEVPFTANCNTEGDAHPHFIVPSCAAYHDPNVPEEHLRMVGCKPTVVDQWREYLTEAGRIDIKHHVCLDEDLSDQVIRDMHANGLRTCMPKVIIEYYYAGRDVVDMLFTIEDLISELRRVSVGRKNVE